jgi:nitroreductase
MLKGDFILRRRIENRVILYQNERMTVAEEIIRNRKSVYPRFFTDQPVSDSDIWQLLEAANWAPTHRMTEPWRFIVLQGEKKDALGDVLASAYKEQVGASGFSERKFQSKKQKAVQSSAVLAIILQRDPEERLPEWEELAASSAAVQNLWIMASSLGLGGYWSSPKAITGRHEFFSLPEGQTCYGLFYLGHHNMPEVPRERSSIQSKVQWWK